MCVADRKRVHFMSDVVALYVKSTYTNLSKWRSNPTAPHVYVHDARCLSPSFLHILSYLSGQRHVRWTLSWGKICHCGSFFCVNNPFTIAWMDFKASSDSCDGLKPCASPTLVRLLSVPLNALPSLPQLRLSDVFEEDPLTLVFLDASILFKWALIDSRWFRIFCDEDSEFFWTVFW